MLWRSFVLVAVFSFAFFEVEAKIIETRYVEDVIPLIDHDTWFLVDLDNCMFEAAQALGHNNWWYDVLQERMTKGMTKAEATRDAYPLWVKTQKACRVKPLEKNFIPILVMLQNQGVVIMGLTHPHTSVVDSTLKQVASLGFDFSKTAPSQACFVVPYKNPTLYSQGVLFVCDYNKKIDVFKTFLNMINQKPKKVVLIDDKRKNVEELEKLTQYGIEYIGVHYTAIDYAKPLYDAKIAKFQMKYLDQILSNESAQLLMESGLE